MDTSKFEAIKNKARKMIHEDAKQDAHIIKARQADRNNPKFFSDQPSDVYSSMSSFGSNSSNNMNESYVDNGDSKFDAAMKKQMNLYESKKEAQQQIPVQQTQTILPMNKNLPKEILESFSDNYIDQSVFNPNRSVLDRIGVTDDTVMQQQAVTENVQHITNQQPNINGKIDYEIIKSIVESSVKKYVSALGKKMLTENKSVGNLDEINAIQITDKKIAIVTKNGNLFEGQLKFIKNVKEN